MNTCLGLTHYELRSLFETTTKDQLLLSLQLREQMIENLKQELERAKSGDENNNRS